MKNILYVDDYKIARNIESYKGKVLVMNHANKILYTLPDSFTDEQVNDVMQVYKDAYEKGVRDGEEKIQKEIRAILNLSDSHRHHHEVYYK